MNEFDKAIKRIHVQPEDLAAIVDFVKNKPLSREEELELALALAVKYISEACGHAPVYVQNSDWWIRAVKGEVDTIAVFRPWLIEVPSKQQTKTEPSAAV